MSRPVRFPAPLAVLLLAAALPSAADDAPWSLANPEAGSLAISRDGEQHWHGTLVYKPSEPDPSLLSTPQVPIEIAYKDPVGDTPSPVTLDGQGTQARVPPLSLRVPGYDQAVLFARRTPYVLTTPEPTYRSLEYVLFLENETTYVVFSYDAKLTSNRAAEEVHDRFSSTLAEALAKADAAAARRSFLCEEALRFLSRKDALAAHHQLSFEQVVAEFDGRTETVFPRPDEAGSVIPWSRVPLAIEPGKPVRLVFRVRAAERQAFVDRVGDPVDKAAAKAIVRVEEPRFDGTKSTFEAIADEAGIAKLSIDGFGNEMKKDFSVQYPLELGLDHQPTFGQFLLRWGRPLEGHLDTGVFPLPTFPEADDDAAIQGALIETLFSYYDPDANQFRKGQRTATTEELPFFAATLIKWRKLGGELGSRVATGAIQRFRKTYAHHDDYFVFQKYLLGVVDAAAAKTVLTARAAEYTSYPPDRWTLEWADDLLAAISLSEMEKDSSFLTVAETLADGLVARIRQQPEPSTFHRGGPDEGWTTGDAKPTRPHAHAAVALARAHTHLEKEGYLSTAFDQGDHLMDAHGIKGPIRLKIEASSGEKGTFLPSGLASVGLAYEYLERFGGRGKRCGEANAQIRKAFLRVLRTKGDRLELRDLLEMTRYFFDYLPTGA